jgi:hypothetical protein
MAIPEQLTSNPRISRICDLNEKIALYKLRLVINPKANYEDFISTALDGKGGLYFHLYTYDLFKRSHQFVKQKTFDVLPLLPSSGEALKDDAASSSSSTSSSSSATIEAPSIVFPRRVNPITNLFSLGLPKSENVVVWESEAFIIRGVNLATAVFAVMCRELAQFVRLQENDVLQNIGSENTNLTQNIVSLAFECWQSSIDIVDQELSVDDAELLATCIRNRYRKNRWTRL